MTTFDKWNIPERVKLRRIDGSLHRKYIERKSSGENFDESIASRQNSSDFSPVKILHCTVSDLQ